MKLKNAILELLKSGLIPVFGGAYLITTMGPDVSWGLTGLGFVIPGLFIGNDYMNKSFQDTSKKWIQEKN